MYDTPNIATINNAILIIVDCLAVLSASVKNSSIILLAFSFNIDASSITLLYVFEYVEITDASILLTLLVNPSTCVLAYKFSYALL